jgi:copper homeostasis protein
MASALAAQEGGAQRIELTASLLEGGLTPSAGTIALTRAALNIDIIVMIRPRGGDFLYSDIEFDVMKHDIKVAKELGADGVVFGILTPNGEIDRPRMAELAQLARPMSITCHRAFDMVKDPYAALDTLLELGFDRLLTSGTYANPLDGIEVIAALVRQADNRITIMPGGGVTLENAAEIVRRSGVRDMHTSARETQPSSMRYWNERISFGGNASDRSQAVTTPARVGAFVDALNTVAP